MTSPSTLAELKVEYVHDDNTSLVGLIDKIVMVRNEQGQEYLAVVDYKSGAESFEEKLLPYGWSLQLPIYALMLENHPEFKGKEILGLFIQHIIEASLLAKTMDIGEETFPKSYQLDGIILADKSKIALLDRTMKSGKSSFIEGVSLVKSGEFKKTNHVKTAGEIKAFAQEAKKKIT
jgi:ATP-dependent helicase/nuclease subunit B